MGLKDYSSNHAETKETHSIKRLRTHYYYTNQKTVLDALEKHFNAAKDSVVKNRDDTYGELFVQGSKFHLVVSVHAFHPKETSVDFKVQTYRLIGRHRPKTIIFTLYKYLNKTLKLKGTSLHP
jgi:hypothetical protein